MGDLKHVKIGDLGLSKLVQRRGVNVKGLGFSGTSGYIAPKVWSDDAYSTGYSTRVDNWSLGCILVDIAHPTECGEAGAATILSEAGFEMKDEYETDIALMLADPCNAGEERRKEVLDCIIDHPSVAEDRTAQSIISNCLVVDPLERWGCTETLHEMNTLNRAGSIF